MSKCTSSAGRFDGHGGAPVQYEAYCPMQHVQGFTKSYWMLPLGDYSLCITPAAARVTSKQTMMKNTPTLLAVLMAMMMCRYLTTHIAQWRRSRVSLEAIGRHRWASINYNYIKGTFHCCFFVVFFIVNRAKWVQSQRMAPNNNRAMTYQTVGKHLSKMVGYLAGGVNIAFNCI
jgi:hypothetical protein